MKKLIIILIAASVFAGCRFRIGTPICDGCNPPVYVQESNNLTQTSTTIYYEDYCIDEPYYHAAEWCDWYDDNTTCCVWYSDGWFEEYCQWDYDYCWEYNGSF